MARKRSKSSSQVRRDASAIASGTLLDLSSFVDPGRDLQIVEDRREFHPASFRPARMLRSPVRFGLFAAPAKMPGRRARQVKLSAPVSFHAPATTMVCVRREQRREVLHALRKTGRRGGGRSPRRGPFSSIVCRRR